ncbi:NACHT domain-containing protein [Fusarium falciforme]|uniref:NACHT domain-containing protein n=1 Tax=Fusarium falciforme TaxID=195108 RepID=UPI002301300A|nr:NACHT domain-containing protein [Fusarium falciforme]WAO94557.1 NACHT domain-containing protein [Fusarium falciforme]
MARLWIKFLDRDNPTWDAWRSLIESEDAARGDKEAETIPPGPLYYAIKLNLTDIAISLTTEQNVKERSSLGKSALGIACANGSRDVDILLEKGADMTAADNNGGTPLFAASNNGHVEVVKLLLEKGADMTIANNIGLTPLIAASRNGHVEVVKLLVGISSVDASKTDRLGRTALFFVSGWFSFSSTSCYRISDHTCAGFARRLRMGSGERKGACVASWIAAEACGATNSKRSPRTWANQLLSV